MEVGNNNICCGGFLGIGIRLIKLIGSFIGGC